MPLNGGSTVAGYTIVRRLGSGGMGEVYLLEQETPLRVCTKQTGQTRRECRRDIMQSNGLP